MQAIASPSTFGKMVDGVRLTRTLGIRRNDFRETMVKPVQRTNTQGSSSIVMPRSEAPPESSKAATPASAVSAFLSSKKTKPDATPAPQSAVPQRTLVVPELLEGIVNSNLPVPGTGKPVEGIPGADPKPDARSIAVVNSKTGEVITTPGAEHDMFAQQSMSKPAAHFLLIRLMGDRAVERTRLLLGDAAVDAAKQWELGWELGLRESNQEILGEGNGEDYKSNKSPPGREDLEYNTSVNKGALKVWALIRKNTPPGDKTGFDHYLDLIRDMAGNQTLQPNETMAEGEYQATMKTWAEKKEGNWKLIEDLIGKGVVKDAEEGKQILKDYYRACAITMNVIDSAVIGATLHDGVHPLTKQRFAPREIAQEMRSGDRTGGAYNESGQIARKGGARFKTGVKGGQRGSLVHQRHLFLGMHHEHLNKPGNPLEPGKWTVDLSRRGQLVTPGDLAAEEAAQRASEGMTKKAGRQVAKATGKERTYTGKVPLAVPAGSPLAGARGTVEAKFKTSPLELHKRLLADMTDDSKEKLRTALGVEDLSEVRLKPMRDIISLKLGTRGGERMLTALNARGENMDYFEVPDHKGFKRKIVVAPHVNLESHEDRRTTEIT
ncbi:MAG TPA: glutaminase [Albitalea sp.]|uniref:glutaminase n=1 Tax=Piscinibacter sp. TaxID=1903157 RepID=UPI002ED4C2DD